MTCSSLEAHFGLITVSRNNTAPKIPNRGLPLCDRNDVIDLS